VGGLTQGNDDICGDGIRVRDSFNEKDDAADGPTAAGSRDAEDEGDLVGRGWKVVRTERRAILATLKG
jgi:hypothetical protein